MARKRDMTPLCADSAYLITDDIINTAVTMVQIDGLPPEVRQDTIIRALFDYGQIGYIPPDRSAWAAGFYRIGRIGEYDENGNARAYTLRGFATKAPQFVMPADNVVLLRSRAYGATPRQQICRLADMAAICDRAIMVNILGSMLSRMYAIDKPDDELDIQQALSAAMAGLPATVKTDILNAFSSADVSIPFIAPDIKALQQTILSELRRRFGGTTPAAFKAERTQSAEVSAAIGEGIDSIYSMITQFNRDAEYGGVPFRMSFVGFAEQDDPDIPADTSNTSDTPDQGDGQSDEGGINNAP